MECEHQRDGDHCPLCQQTRTQGDLLAASALATKEGGEVEGHDDTLVRGGAGGPKHALGGGSKIGRYVIIDMLGAGGMGIIYSAYDPRLDRRIALKVLRGTTKKVPGSNSKFTDGQARLLREAQAMAQLSHPNVVPVYDVGPYEDSVYVAMELVQGATLSQWEREKKRSWREVLDVFIAAGRGLEAAHLAGLVHRDFKPANVLMSKEGQPKVTDFGLARSTRDSSSGSHKPEAIDATEPESISEVTPALDQPLTMKGAVMGSPGYMAPEQYRGTETSAATDQFAFCVALYEGFYGIRPFLGRTLEELAQATHKGEVPDPPKGSQVPRWIHEILKKGLSADPNARHKSMTELLAALSHDPRRARMRVLLAAGVAALLGVAVAATVYSARQQAQVCRGMERKLDGVWDADVSKRVETAFNATGKSYAPLAFSRARDALDKYARAWVASRTDACEATLVRHQQSEQQLGQRTACLDRRREELHTLAGAFAQADGPLVDQALEAASRLTPVDRCDKLKAGADQPLSGEEKKSFDELEQQIDQAKALGAAGKFEEARTKLLPVVDQAKKLKLSAVEAEAAETLGEVESDAHHFPEAKVALEAGVRAAEAIGDDELAARGMARLISVVGWRLETPQVGFTLAQVASGVIERLGGNELLEGQVEEGLGDSEWQLGHRPESLAHYRAAQAHYLKVLAADSLDVARIHSSIGWVLFEQGEFADARAEIETSLKIRTATFGEGHPALSASWNELGSLAKQRGDYDEAVTDFLRCLAIDEATFGIDGTATGTALINATHALAEAHRADEAELYLERARKLFASLAHLPQSRKSNFTWTEASVLTARGRYPEAVKLARQALAEDELSLGADHPETGSLHGALADALAGAHQYPEALEHYERFLAIEEKVGATQDTDYAKGLVKAGEVLRALGRGREGLERIERGERLLDNPKVYAGATADAKLALADAAWTVQKDHARARTLALDAQQTFAQLKKKDDAARAEKWLQTHTK
ncbi:MAG: serine/threonine-protein kinase [Myxococcaceae bacterium]